MFLVAFLALTAVAMQAQDRTLTGTVYDQDGLSVIGANVYVKGNPSKGVATDLDGKFELTLSENENTIIVSYVGYATKRVKVDGQSNVEITLSEDVELSEVVVTPLGVERDEKALGYAV